MTSETQTTSRTNATRHNAARNSAASHDIYTDPQLAQTGAEKDPLFQALQQHWKPVVTVIAAAIVAIYFMQSFRDSYDASMRSAADIFARIQNDYQTHLTLTADLNRLSSAENKETAKIEEAQKKLAENRSQLEQLLNSAADAREPYKSLSVLYRALVLKGQDSKQAEVTLERFRNWGEIGSDRSNERFFAESGALLLGRLLLEDPVRREEAKSLIKSLADDGYFVSAAASRTLESLS